MTCEKTDKSEDNLSAASSSRHMLAISEGRISSKHCSDGIFIHYSHFLPATFLIIPANTVRKQILSLSCGMLFSLLTIKTALELLSET